MSSTENLFDTLDLFFTGLNFKAKKRLWYKQLNDGFIVCQFQRFRFDSKGSGFLNFGVVFMTKDKRIRVPGGEDTWDLRGRYNAIAEDNIEETFPIELTSESDKEKVRVALSKIKEIVIPYLERYSELRILVNDLKEKKFDFSRALTRISA